MNVIKTYHFYYGFIASFVNWEIGAWAENIPDSLEQTKIRLEFFG